MIFRLHIFFLLGSALVWDTCLAAQNNKFILSDIGKCEYLITKGKDQRAAELLHDLYTEKSSKLNKAQKYRLITDLSKIYFWNENLAGFKKYAEEAYSNRPSKSEIYKAYFYMQKAAYFHFFLEGDSCVFWADRSLQLFYNHRQDFKLVPSHFIFQIYATSFLYRIKKIGDISFSLHKKKLFLQPFAQYFDSSLHYIKRIPHFPQEEAILLRSRANRLMDVVQYQIRNKPSELPFYNFQMATADLAITKYNEAIRSLPKNEKRLRTQLTSLKALAYFSTARGNQGEVILWPLIKKFKKDPLHQMGYRLNSSLYALQYYTQYLLSKKKLHPHLFTVITIYKKLLPIWDAYLLSDQFEKKDTYGNSPYLMLSFIYGRLLKDQPSNSAWLKTSATLSIENYRYYSKELKKAKRQFKSKKYLKFLSQLDHPMSCNDFNFNDYIDQKPIDRNSLLNKIQETLKEGEALLIQSDGMVNRKVYFLITKARIRFELPHEQPVTVPSNLQTISTPEFKRIGLKYFKNLPFNFLFRSKNITKLYVAADIRERFDLMIRDTSGSNFSELHYLKKQVNIVKIFNPIDFFTQRNSYITPNLKSFLINQASQGQLPFSEEFLSSISSKKNIHYKKKSNLSVFSHSALQSSGLLHLIGHGGISVEKNSGWKTSLQQAHELKLQNVTDSVKNDLIILDLCFGSFKRLIFLPDRDLQNNLISRGAKAVIASPYQTVDQSSAYIFEKFYTYLDQGITAEDALQKAKMDYLKTHKGSLAHPIYWSTYELTTNVKDLRIAPKTKPFPWEWIPIFTFLVGVGGAAWWSLRR